MVLLFRGYLRTGLRLLFWSALCFVFLSVNNVLLFLDMTVYAEIDLRLYLFAVAFMLLSPNQGIATFLEFGDERTVYAYSLRVLGFLLILWAIIEKNLQARRA
jgi:hypothetical protein